MSATTVAGGRWHVRARLVAAQGRSAAAQRLARLRAAWRRSLQLRVVVSTLVLSAMVVGVLAYVLVHRVVDGLVENKQRVALAEAASGFAAAQTSASTDEGSPVDVINGLARSVSDRSGPNEPVSLVILGAAPDAGGRAVPDDVLDQSVPGSLRRAVRAADASQAYAYTTLHHRDGRAEPALAVGSPLFFPGSNSLYQLYYLFPLRQEVTTISLVRRAVALSGGALVLLLAGIAWLVTRQVVTPVRMAARTAERLAAGRLTERMTVKGEDDLARLATSFNRMARNLQRQIEQLEELSRLQRRFVADVSHELRTPLTTVRMAADVLYEARPGFPAATGRAAELLQHELDRFESLLADLLEISRYDAGAAVLEAEPTDMDALVARVTAVVRPLAERRGSDLVVRVVDAPCIAEVDPRRVERVLRNLVANAVEHGEGRDISITLAADEGAVAVTVRDYGVGLSLDEVDQVFARFWRADPARARATGGTGLGLSIALEDTHLHGGWLEAWGAPANGSQFRLTLPRQAGAEVVRSPLPLQPADARLVLRSGVSGA